MRLSLLASSLAIVAACSSKPTPSVEVLHRTDGDLDVKVRHTSVKGSTRMGKAWIATEGFAMDVTRGKDFLQVPWLDCAATDEKTFEVRLDAARSLLSYRCKPGAEWVVEHVGETALHVDCRANAGAAAEPALIEAKTLVERAEVLAQCAMDEKLAGMARDMAMRSLALDVHHASKSDARTADVLFAFLDELAPREEFVWPQTIWDTELLPGKQKMPASVYPVVQRRAAARLGSAKTLNELVALASVADTHEAAFKTGADKAMKVITAAPRSGLRDLAASLVIGPLIDVDPPRAAALGCEGLGANMTNGTAAFAVSRSAKECPAVTTMLHSHPHYSKVWFEMKCRDENRDQLADMPARFNDDKFKRKVLVDPSIRANPHDLVDWESGLLAATCPTPKKKK